MKLEQQPTFHCLVGGKIQDMQKLLPRVQDKNVKLVICAGVNNLPFQSSANIIDDLKVFAGKVRNEHVFCLLPYPPKFCEHNGKLQHGMIQKIEEVNKWINNHNKYPTVDLSLYGSQFDDGQLSFRYNDWKERSPKKMLHFATKIKKLIAQKLASLCCSKDEWFSSWSENKLSWNEDHTSLPLARDFIPKITPVITAVHPIPGLVFVNKKSAVRKISPPDSVVCSFQDKVNFYINNN